MQLTSWLGGSMPSSTTAGRVHRAMGPKCGRQKQASKPRAEATPKPARPVKVAPVMVLPKLVLSLRDRMNELLIRNLDLAIDKARTNARLADRLRIALNAESSAAA